MVVRLGVNEPFCRDTACVCAGHDTPRTYEWLVAVAREAGVSVEVSAVRFEDDFAPVLAAGELDGVIAKAWTALTAFRVAGIACERLCDFPLPDGSPDLMGVFIAATDGPVRSMHDLNGRRLGTGGPESYENFHAVTRTLESLDIRPMVRRPFDRCVHAAVSVIEGETDAAVVSNYCLRFGLDTYVGRPGAFRTLGETAPIPYATLALSTRVPGSLRTRLQTSLLDASARAASRDRYPGGLRPPAAWVPEELDRL